jgi:hypothetical protein
VDVFLSITYITNNPISLLYNFSQHKQGVVHEAIFPDGFHYNESKKWFTQWQLPYPRSFCTTSVMAQAAPASKVVAA